jgi:zinc protease
VTDHQEVRREERDGVRTLWIEQPGPLQATLMFRVGRADETLRTHGTSHVVEHLALWRERERTHAYNGWVSDTITGFWASGTADQICAFLSEVCAALRALPADRLHVERRVLSAESAGSVGGPFDLHRSLRFGPSAYGLAHYYEFGIDWLAGDAVQRWADEWFTAENAVLALTGPPPDGLSLALAHGERRSPPPPREVDGLVLPARTEGGSGGVSLTAMGNRSAALHCGFNTWIDRAVARLRRLEGMSYAPAGAYDVLDGRRVSLFVTADCRRGDVPTAERLLLSIADELAGAGPTADELADNVRKLEEWVSHPDALASRLDWHARDELHGVDAMSAAGLLAERRRVTSEDVARAMSEPLTSLLVVGALFPEGSDQQRLPRLDRGDPPAQRGRTFRSTAQWRAFKVDMTVDLGDEGITYRQRYTQKHLPGEQSTTVLFADLVAGVEMPSGALTLVSRWGIELTLHTERLERGDELFARLEQELGEDRLIPLSEVQRRVVEEVHEALSFGQRGALGGEIDRLPAILGEREAIRLMATAKRRNDRGEKESGLVVVTDLRALYMFAGPGNTDIREFPRRASIATTSGVLRKKLVIEHERVHVELTEFEPSDALQATYDLMSQTAPPSTS